MNRRDTVGALLALGAMPLVARAQPEALKRAPPAPVRAWPEHANLPPT